MTASRWPGLCLAVVILFVPNMQCRAETQDHFKQAADEQGKALEQSV